MTFDDFWQAYPRRVTTPRIAGKPKAQEKCEALVKAGTVTWEELVAGAKQYADCDNVMAGYIKLPMTWLNGDGWGDEYDRPAERETPEWWRERCVEATEYEKSSMDRFNNYYRRDVPTEIRAEFPELFKLRAV